MKPVSRLLVDAYEALLNKKSLGLFVFTIFAIISLVYCLAILFLI